MVDSISKDTPKQELKGLLILGTNIFISPEIKRLYTTHKQDGYLIIGNGINQEDGSITIEKIKAELEDKNLIIGSKTRIDVFAHGIRQDDQDYKISLSSTITRKLLRKKKKSHQVELSSKNLVKTKDFFEALRTLSNHPLYVHLWSCYSGTASKDVKSLGPDSTLVTHVQSKYMGHLSLIDHALKSSMERYIKVGGDLSPSLQYILDQKENYQATIFSCFSKKKGVEQFKSMRNPERNSVAVRLSKMKKDDDLAETISKYLQNESSRFVSWCNRNNRNIKYQSVNNIDNKLNEQETKNFITGLLIDLLTISGTTKTENVRKKSLTIATNLLERLKTPKTYLNHQLNGWAPLSCAVFLRDQIMAKLLLDKGANTNVANKGGMMPLHLACNNGHLEIAKLLLDKGANTNVANKGGMMPLHLACSNGYVEIAKLLLDKGANPNVTDKGGVLPLHLACNNGYVEIAKLLLDKGANPNVTDKGGALPLHLACSNGYIKIAKLLLDKGANPNVTDKGGVLPLHLAYSNGYIKIAKLLLDKGANPYSHSNPDNSTKKDNRTLKIPRDTSQNIADKIRQNCLTQYKKLNNLVKNNKFSCQQLRPNVTPIDKTLQQQRNIRTL